MKIDQRTKEVTLTEAEYYKLVNSPVSDDLDEAAKEESDKWGGPLGFPYKPWLYSCFRKGANWQKEKMMKDAVDAEIINWESMFTSIKVMEPEKAEAMIKEKFDIGDKVKLIIIKEE